MNKLIYYLKEVGKRQDVMLGLMLMGAIFMMVLPLPTAVVDVLISFNLTVSVLLLMLAIYISSPLEFSAFPSLLLLTTLFRLSLTVSTSRLILMNHDAGEIVYAFGDFVVGGNMVVGLIVFLIIAIVQFIVITKGAERVAEVGARFSLDGMPGKQMSIDGDLRAGVIDSQEAKRQRGEVQKESQLYGAMDGAMKFVKGDAIASLIVILVNLVGGLCVGIFIHDMSAGESFHLYSLLSIGNGLVDQIPGLLISITAGVIVTRVPDEDKKNLAKTVVGQLSSKPTALLVAMFLVLIFAFIPGFPFIDFMVLSLILGGGLLSTPQGKNWLRKIRGQEIVIEEKEEKPDELTTSEPLNIVVKYPVNNPANYRERLQMWVSEKSKNLGFPLPELSVSIDAKVKDEFQCVVKIYGTPVIEETFSSDECLTTLAPGTLQEIGVEFRTKETLTQSLRLNWINIKDAEKQEIQDNASLNIPACILGDDIPEFLLNKIIDRYASEYIGIQETSFLMEKCEPKFTELLREVRRQLSVGKIANIFQRLINESVSLQNLRSIFESLVEWSQKEKDIMILTEYVRISLQRYLSYTYTQGTNMIHVFMVTNETEQVIREAIRQTDSGAYLALTPEQSNDIIERITEVIGNKSYTEFQPVFLTSMDVRCYLRKLIEERFYDFPVLSFQEVSRNIDVKILADV